LNTPRNLDLYVNDIQREDGLALVSTELLLAKGLLSSLQGVAVLATDAKCNVHFANQYAQDIFNLDPVQISFGNGALPKSVKKHLADALKKSHKEFLLQYAVGNHVRSLQVYCTQNATEDGKNLHSVFHMHDISDRVGTELKLRQAESLLRNVIDASPDFICVKDEKNRWLLTNKSCLNLFQIPHQAYQFKTDSEIAALADPTFKDFFKHLKSSDEIAWRSDYAIRNEEVITLPHGGAKVFDVIKIAMFNDDGSKQGLLTIGRDISERKLAEGHLRDRSAILDTLISCDWMLHSSSSWETIAPKVLEQLCTAARFSRASIFKNNENKDQAQQASSALLLDWNNPGIQALDKTLTLINFDNTQFKRWLDILKHGNPIFGNVKELPSSESKALKAFGIEAIMIVPIFVDKVWWGNLLIEHHQALIKFTPQELGAMMAISRSLGVAIEKQSTGERLQQAKIAFDSASEGIMIVDANSNIIAINKGFTEITGFTEEEVLGTTPKIFTTGKHNVWEDIAKDGKWKGEVANHRKNGQPYQEWLTLTAVKNQQGNVINYVGVFADITDIKASQKQLNKLVNHDALTGLPNRRLLNELLDHAIKRGEREQQAIAVLFIDLDRFKAINDSLGHQVGDKLLFEASTRISQSIRESDVVARLGGDEFLVMMNLISKPDDAALVAQKIIHALQAEFIINGKEIFIGASIGIAISFKDGNDVDSLIKAADIAMYQVKNRGKNNYCFYSDELSTNAVARFTMENQLRRSLERHQFELFYQPQVHINTGEIIGAEALVRWNHPELGLVSPAQFIPVAEETGLIVQIGEWVLKQAAMQVMSWNSLGLKLKWVSVNVSGVQIMRGNFADTVYGVLIETDCEPTQLELEITESTVMQNTEYVIDTFKRIKKLGVRLAIDDFGTGYSSLSNLKRLPLDKIKIDQSFVRDLPDDLDDAVIANTINAMAHSLGFSVIAEGVETKAQADFLENIGCHEAQGYLYGKPINVADFTKLLELNKKQVKTND
jgi:diguanylate cyclase (GGDEF)-like protein/PAS domain S-box-containing protein